MRTLLVATIICAIAACKAPASKAPATGEVPTARVVSRALRPDSPGFELAFTSEAALKPLIPTAESRARLSRPRRAAFQQPSNVARLLHPIDGAHYVMDRGQTLLDILAGFPPERAALGSGALTVDQAFGGLCEDPMVDLQAQHDGETYELRYNMEILLAYTELIPALYALSSTCTGALLMSAGDVAAAVGNGCAPEDEAAHFSAGSNCRSCLAIDGDHARCVASNRCQREMTRELGVWVDGQTQYYDVLEALMLGCAPNILGQVMVLASELGETNQLGTAFDHQAVAQFCVWQWHLGENGPRPFCRGKEGTIRPALADFVVGHAEWIRRPGEDGDIYGGRRLFASYIELDGLRFENFTLFPGYTAQLSERDAVGGWNFNPQDLRPEGTDPTNIDHTYGRDWIAALGLKNATLIDGISVGIFIQNLCQPDDWRGPDAQGRFFCRDPYSGERDPIPDLWAYDTPAFRDPASGITEIFPILTLLGSGLMDPKIAGGHAPQIYGGPTLADPQWDNCAWPDRFLPDEMATNDHSDAEPFTFTAQTYRFGKDPTQSMRVGMRSNTRRMFCFEKPADL